MITTKKKTEKKIEKKAEKQTDAPKIEKTQPKNKVMTVLRKVFGGLEMSWRNVIAFAIIMGTWTALMALLVPDGNSFHDIVATPEWWVLPAIFIIVNCKKPVEAALKTFVFFLISQPLVYLIQVPFNSMGWQLFQFYKYWFIITLLTLPGAFIGWFIKHDKWYSGIILSVMTFFLAYTAFGYVKGFEQHFPDHLISVIYCFVSILFYIFVIFKDKIPRLITLAITIIAMLATVPFAAPERFETVNTSFLNGIDFVGEPYVSVWSGDCEGKVELVTYSEELYSFRFTGCMGHEYTFSIADKATEQKYDFKYYFDKEQNTMIVERR